MERVVGSQHIVDELYGGLSGALADLQGPRTAEDALIDKLSKGVQTRRSKVRAAEPLPLGPGSRTHFMAPDLRSAHQSRPLSSRSP